MASNACTASVPLLDRGVNRLIVARHVGADTALHSGDPTGRIAMWSTNEPVTLAYEHITASIYGAPAKPYTLRVTHVYRRENGEWKVVHRHADPIPFESITETGESRSTAPSGWRPRRHCQ